MALRALQGPTGGGAPVGGTGITNTIPRWTGPSTLGDSGLIDDGSQIYTTSRVLAVNTATTLGTGLIRFQVGSASTLANYQGAQAGFMLPTGSGSWVEFCENSASGTTFRISKDASTGVVLNANGKNMGFNASGYTTAVASSQMVLLTSGNVGIGTASPYTRTESSTARTTALTSIAAFASMPLTVTDTTAFAPGVGGGINFRGQLTSSSYTNFAAIWAARESANNSDYRGSLILATADNAGGYPVERARIDSAGNLILNTANTGATIQAAGTSQGLKLPATPGNTDPNTLDAYVDGGTAGSGGKAWTIADNSGAGLALTITSCEYIQVGKAITICVDVTFPVTASAANANLSLPVAAKGNWHAGTVAFQSAGAGGLAELTVMCNGAEIAFYAGTTSTRQTNANLSNKRLIFSITYFTAQ